MATTIVACALRYDQAVVSHVGDSRCYLVRNGQARQITQDHTLVNEQRKMGLISADEIASSDSRHVLIRSWGRRCSSLPTPWPLPCSQATCWFYAPTDCTTR
jgi:serine/threonine protein phosphatase PrpC